MPSRKLIAVAATVLAVGSPLAGPAGADLTAEPSPAVEISGRVSGTGDSSWRKTEIPGSPEGQLTGVFTLGPSSCATSASVHLLVSGSSATSGVARVEEPLTLHHPVGGSALMISTKTYDDCGYNWTFDYVVAAPSAEPSPIASPIASPMPTAEPTPAPTTAPTAEPTQDPLAEPDLVVSPTGSDSNPGTMERPLRTVGKGLQSIAPGEVLLLRGGTYVEQILNPTLAVGTAQQPIRVAAAPGERPVIKGLLWLRNASHWHFDGVNVTWDDRVNKASQHMVKMTGGTGWTFSGAELWGARSFAALLIAGDANDWRVTRNYIHDTFPSNGTNQDHLIYANADGSGGVIDHNLLVGSANGRAVKVGPPRASSGPVRNIEIAYNTMYNNLGPSNVQIAWDSFNTKVHHNIMVKPAANRSAVTAYQLTGTGNVVTDNLYWDAVRVMDTGVAGMTMGPGNAKVDPKFTGLGTRKMQATNPIAVGYGHTHGTLQ